MTLLRNVLAILRQAPRRRPCLLLLLGLAVTAGPAYADRHFVDQAVVGGNGSGSDWQNAFDDLQDALDVAITGDEVWVAAGTYVPTLRTDPTDARSATFELVDGVALFGGFSGGETALEQRNPDPMTNGCVLDGLFDGLSSVYHVVTARSVGIGTLLDGFVVTGGAADGGTVQTDVGGGIYHVSDVGGILTLRHLLVVDNRTAPGGSGLGAGLFTAGGEVAVHDSAFVVNTAGQGGAVHASSNVTISNTRFAGNWTTFSGGGGLFVTSNGNVAVADSLFVENFGNNQGGAILAENIARVQLDRVTLQGNVTRTSGAGVYLRNSARLIAVSSAFVGNTATVGNGKGGALSVDDLARAVLTNCTLAGNVATLNGGGIVVFSSGGVTVQNSVLYGNTAGLNPGNPSAQQLFVDPASSAVATVTFSVVEGGFAGPNLSGDPLFVRTPDPGDGDWETPADNDFGDLRLRSGSPAVDAGDNTADLDADGSGTETIADVPTDLAGGPRLFDDPHTPDTGVGPAPIVDIGAHERGPLVFADGFESGDATAWSATTP